MCNKNLNPDDSETDESEDGQDSEEESTPQQVAEEAVENLGKKPSIITGAPNRRKMFLVSRLLPRKIGVAQIGKHALKNFLDSNVPKIDPNHD